MNTKVSIPTTLPSRRFAIAPMMDYTDRHDRYFLRLITRHAWLYTEMVTTGALLHNDPARFLDFNASEHPIALQLGGSDPKGLAQCAKFGEEAGYDEININIGCPSDRVSSGRFGACLMAEPALVADMIRAMKEQVSLPVTVKTRLGIDQLDSYEFLTNLVELSHQAGCNTFIIHARKAWLQGLSPKENREIPPLDYARVLQLKQDFPQLEILLNGGLKSAKAAFEFLPAVDGVMLGREAYHNPWILAEVDALYYQDPHPLKTRKQVVREFLPYLDKQMQLGGSFQNISKHLLGIFQGLPGARAWRRHISESAHKSGASIALIEQAMERVSE